MSDEVASVTLEEALEDAAPEEFVTVSAEEAIEEAAAGLEPGAFGGEPDEYNRRDSRNITEEAAPEENLSPYEKAMKRHYGRT